MANKAYEGPVPKDLMDYLQAHKDTLVPGFRQVWEAAGSKPSGTWEQVFGRGPGTDEIFTAWSYARYMGRVIEAGKAEYPLPMYMNSYTYGLPKAGQPTPSAAPPCPKRWTPGEPKRRDSISSRPTIRTTSLRCARSTPNPETRCPSPKSRLGWKARPDRSMPSDTMMRSCIRA